jgi:NAD(P)-dependent dehydrogenase (short-subunit alcohol dehydrogenase family)
MTTTALITGGTSGIGRATANKFAQLGVHVVVVGRNLERGEKTVAEIRKAGGGADFIGSDLRDASSARAVARKALEIANGQVDILVNNAGVYPFGPIHEMTEAAFDEVYYAKREGSLFPRRRTCPIDGETRQRGNRQSLDYGRPATLV